MPRRATLLGVGLLAFMGVLSCSHEGGAPPEPEPNASPAESRVHDTEPTPEAASKSTRLNDLGIEMIDFQLPEGGRTFSIGTYEITNAQYKAFLDATKYDGQDHPSSKEPFFHNWNRDPKWTQWMKSMSGSSVVGSYPADQSNCPACLLNWWHAKAFCDWLSRETRKEVRLPTKGEWLFVAAGSENRKYPWGDEWDPNRCNWAGDVDGFEAAAPVGSFPKGATPEGVHDLAGNIWEWCEDRVLRGGPWCMDRTTVTTSFASKEDTDRADDKFGFRIVLIDDEDDS